MTIDGETARDFDDAVMVTERGDGGFELQVHIADVADYVRRGNGSRSGGEAARDERVFSGSRDSDVAAGAFDGYLQLAARRGPAGAELRDAAERGGAH